MNFLEIAGKGGPIFGTERRAVTRTSQGMAAEGRHFHRRYRDPESGLRQMVAWLAIRLITGLRDLDSESPRDFRRVCGHTDLRGIRGIRGNVARGLRDI
jgi:hypothetical protein